VEWVWSPNVDCGGSCPFTSFYPGDAWVDWVALDGYNYSSVDDMPWRSFAEIFESSYNEMSALTTKPMMIAETSSAEEGGSKAEWITEMFQELPAMFPRIHAVVWFDRVAETDWTIGSSAAALAAWQAIVASPDTAATPADLLTAAPLASDVDSQQSAPPATPGAVPTTTAPGNPLGVALRPTPTPGATTSPSAEPSPLAISTTKAAPPPPQTPLASAASTHGPAHTKANRTAIRAEHGRPGHAKKPVKTPHRRASKPQRRPVKVQTRRAKHRRHFRR
jgi:hypothetical protein